MKLHIIIRFFQDGKITLKIQNSLNYLLCFLKTRYRKPFGMKFNEIPKN